MAPSPSTLRGKQRVSLGFNAQSLRPLGLQLGAQSSEFKLQQTPLTFTTPSYRLFRLEIGSNSGHFVLKCSKIARAFRFELTRQMDVGQTLVQETIAKIGEDAA